jgi:DNA-directed RNA polymerase subunit E'/Rpb7
MQELSQVDDFVFLEGEYCLVGRGTGLRFQIGDKVKVKVVATSLEKRQIDYTLAELPPAKSRTRKKPEPQWEGPSAGKGKKGGHKPKKKH